jgi:hypothetical protein
MIKTSAHLAVRFEHSVDEREGLTDMMNDLRIGLIQTS